MVIHDAQARGVAADLITQKHLHSLPAGSSGIGFLELLCDIEHQLAEAQPSQLQLRPNQPKRRRLGAEDGDCAEWPDHLIVAHVNEPKVALVPGALLGDGQDGVGINRGDAGVDDFKLCLRVALGQ